MIPLTTFTLQFEAWAPLSCLICKTRCFLLLTLSCLLKELREKSFKIVYPCSSTSGQRTWWSIWPLFFTTRIEHKRISASRRMGSEPRIVDTLVSKQSSKVRCLSSQLMTLTTWNKTSLSVRTSSSRESYSRQKTCSRTTSMLCSTIVAIAGLVHWDSDNPRTTRSVTYLNWTWAVFSWCSKTDKSLSTKSLTVS